MTCCILLLFILTSCVCASLVVDVTQSSYQAEENHNITLEWTFTTRTDGSLNSLNIICDMFTDVRLFTLFHLHEGVEVPESQHERFAGRVQFDKDVLREGRLRLHMSRLRTDDSGLYQCDVFTGHDERSKRCHLNVTERDRPKPETPNSSSGGRGASRTGSPSQAERRGWIVLYCGLGLIVAGTLLGVCYYLRRKHSTSSSAYKTRSIDFLHTDEDESSLLEVRGRGSKATSEGLVVMI
ncbi:uncharacterized protein LOC116385699 isoform X2 [Anarrhichthys ocellatus]|uniref:uncharacterized protein LOC116385699 isoform X2 n=1 Tax=Anarrhichthys ocellatus TaxID=433405 RepID=UPI0012ED61A0|nr:uncharacterized protein LOC116385699 isoform X2 [Anarrhichthys ocellatus]